MYENERDAANDSLEMEQFTPLPADLYRCKLQSIYAANTKFGETLKFKWKIVGGELNEETFNALTTRRLTPKAKLTTWAKAHLDIDQFPEGFVLKLSSLIGREVYITLAVAPMADGQGEKNVVQALLD